MPDQLRTAHQMVARAGLYEAHAQDLIRNAHRIIKRAERLRRTAGRVIVRATAPEPPPPAA